VDFVLFVVGAHVAVSVDESKVLEICKKITILISMACIAGVMVYRRLTVNMLLKLFGKGYKDQYLRIKSLTNASELMQFQTDHIAALLLHADRNVPYYSNLFSDEGFLNGGEFSPSAFERIPLLTKKIVQEKLANLTATDIQKRKWFYVLSGGSTGEPTRFIQDNVFTKWGHATSHYYYDDMLGINELAAKKVLLWGAPRDTFRGTIGTKATIENWLNNTVVLNSFRMTQNDLERFIRIINARKPELIRGYAGPLYELCNYAESKQIALHTPKRLVSAAETLTKEMREMMEGAFGTKVYNHYGAREITNIAGECRDGRMHVFSFWNYLEVLDEKNRPVQTGQEGKVVLTNLFNCSMPLIRYEIGDTAVLGPKKCTCGNPLPTLEKLTGRIIERFLLDDGTIIPGEYFIYLIGIVCNREHIKRYQVIQADYKEIEILYVPKGELSDSERGDIESKIRIVMPGCIVKWRRVDDIPATETGKYIATKSLVWN